MAKAAPGTQSLLGVEVPEGEPLTLIKALAAGLPLQSLRHFKQAAGLADDQMATLLQIGGRTLTRVKASRARRLPADLSDRLYSIASIYALADDVFGTHDVAVGWMSEPQFALGDHSPLELLSTELGRGQVRQLLNQIEHGQLA
jgi:putative toxin-antitoxin system antitoxin component (TIGR02293 family)